MRYVSPTDYPGPRAHHQTRHCEAEGCVEATREGKAFCSGHVDKHHYVHDLLARIAERNAQDEAVGKRGSKAVVRGSITAQELIQHLSLHGPRTEERLRRELNLDSKTLAGYIAALVNERVLVLGQTKRGSTLVKMAKRRRSGRNGDRQAS